MAIVLAVSPLLGTKEFPNVFFLLLTRWYGTKVELRISIFQAARVVSSRTRNKDHQAAKKYTLRNALAQQLHARFSRTFSKTPLFSCERQNRCKDDLEQQLSSLLELIRGRDLSENSNYPNRRQRLQRLSRVRRNHDPVAVINRTRRAQIYRAHPVAPAEGSDLRIIELSNRAC